MPSTHLPASLGGRGRCILGSALRIFVRSSVYEARVLSKQEAKTLSPPIQPQSGFRRRKNLRVGLRSHAHTALRCGCGSFLKRAARSTEYFGYVLCWPVVPCSQLQRGSKQAQPKSRPLPGRFGLRPARRLEVAEEHGEHEPATDPKHSPRYRAWLGTGEPLPRSHPPAWRSPHRELSLRDGQRAEPWKGALGAEELWRRFQKLRE